MIMKIEEFTPEELSFIKSYLKFKNKLDDYVILREDENGKRYIEYAFRDGQPKHPTCLSWYSSFQPKALKRNKHTDEDIEWWIKHNLHSLNEIYILYKNNCGADKFLKDDERFCDVGHPSKKCITSHAKKWTYEEPVKCACWSLGEVRKEDFRFIFSFEEFVNFIKQNSYDRRKH